MTVKESPSENDDGTEHTIDTDELWDEIDEEELMRSAVHEIEAEMEENDRFPDE